MIAPPALKSGDKVGLIAPSSPLNFKGDLDHAIALLTALDLVPVAGRHMLLQEGYLAGTDGQRAEDLNGFLRDSSIRGIFSPRGGYGSLRLLDLIDYEALQDDPKIIMGFSDLTTLINAFAVRSGVITFHGPTLVPRFFTPQVVDDFRTVFIEANRCSFCWPTAKTVVPGKGCGQLWGGNLTSFTALVGTPYGPAPHEHVLLIEDLYELPRRLDRSLMQLKHAGMLEKSKALLCGHFFECVTPEGERHRPWSDTLIQALRDVDVPAVADIDVGHVPYQRQTILPIGSRIVVDADAKSAYTSGPVIAR